MRCERRFYINPAYGLHGLISVEYFDILWIDLGQSTGVADWVEHFFRSKFYDKWAWKDDFVNAKHVSFHTMYSTTFCAVYHVTALVCRIRMPKTHQA